MEATVQVHAVFSTPQPTPVFVLAVEVLEGHVTAGMYVHLPLNSEVVFTVRILACEELVNSYGLPLLGLSLHCADGNTGREMNNSLVSCNQIVKVNTAGSD